MLCYMESFTVTARLSRTSSNQIPSLFILAFFFFKVVLFSEISSSLDFMHYRLPSCSFFYMYLSLSLATCFCISASIFFFPLSRALCSCEVKVAQSCLTLCKPMDYIVHGILQARILEWVAFPFSRGSSQPRDQTQVSRIAGRFLTSWATREAKEYWNG